MPPVKSALCRRWLATQSGLKAAPLVTPGLPSSQTVSLCACSKVALALAAERIPPLTRLRCDSVVLMQ